MQTNACSEPEATNAALKRRQHCCTFKQTTNTKHEVTKHAAEGGLLGAMEKPRMDHSITKRSRSSSTRQHNEACSRRAASLRQGGEPGALPTGSITKCADEDELPGARGENQEPIEQAAQRSRQLKTSFAASGKKITRGSPTRQHNVACTRQRACPRQRGEPGARPTESNKVCRRRRASRHQGGRTRSSSNKQQTRRAAEHELLGARGKNNQGLVDQAA